jgi:hypothetical protein
VRFRGGAAGDGMEQMAGAASMVMRKAVMVGKTTEKLGDGAAAASTTASQACIAGEVVLTAPAVATWQLGL